VHRHATLIVQQDTTTIKISDNAQLAPWNVTLALVLWQQTAVNVQLVSLSQN